MARLEVACGGGEYPTYTGDGKDSPHLHRGGEYPTYTGDGKRVETLEPLVVTGLEPASATLGAPVDSITVTGGPFPATDAWSCKVGGTTTPAAWTASGIVRS